MPIQLPGYQTLADNRVFAKGLLVPSDNGDVPCQQILVVNRYAQPTREEVIVYLQRKAGETESAASIVIPGTRRPANGKSLLEREIIELPHQARYHLRTGNQLLADSLAGKMDDLALRDGEHPKKYIQARAGLLTDQMLARYSDARKEDGWYDNVFSSQQLRRMGLGQHWLMQLRHANGLHDRHEVDVLLRNGAFDSWTLKMDGYFEGSEISEALDALYAGLAPEHIEELTDVSSDSLESFALKSIRSLKMDLATAAEIAAEQMRRQMRRP